MTLSRTERWILSNQYRILELLDPNEAESLKEKREAIESGYELHYEDFMPSSEVLSESECKEILDILSMFENIQFCYGKLSQPSEIDRSRITFPGFDGNNEYKQLGYADYYCKHGGGRFFGISVVDSHCPVLERYRRMLNVWNVIKHNSSTINGQRILTEQEIIQIIDA